MNIQLLEEPELEFGNSGRHVDIRFGIKAHGPVSIEDPQAPREIKLGIVGTATLYSTAHPMAENKHP